MSLGFTEHSPVDDFSLVKGPFEKPMIRLLKILMRGVSWNRTLFSKAIFVSPKFWILSLSAEAPGGRAAKQAVSPNP
jgi:hypothetical protein